MSRRLFCAGLLSAVFLAGACRTTSADSDALQATFAVTINALTGRHEVGAGVSTGSRSRRSRSPIGQTGFAPTIGYVFRL